MATTFVVRGLPADVIERIDAAAKAAGVSRNAYIVRVLSERARLVRPVATAETFRRATNLAADLGNEDLMRAAWSRRTGSSTNQR
ncbi:MAG TPA: hypothetical protein VJ649_09665 [Actinomycetes bacterium]|jgi:hypothetical protein|nr:hypothetical protein [Actinomycetes bacterium]